MIIGSRTDVSDSGVSLRAERFNRHTFWCGQSGSGKTYALGVVLEQLLLHTELPLLILDPNADFTRLNEVRSDADTEEARALAEIPVRILHSTSTDGEQVRARFTDLSVASKAAVLQLDPIADAEEFNVLLHIDVDPKTFNNESFITGLRASNDPGKLKLANRIENLQVLEWDLWSRGVEAITDVIDEAHNVCSPTPSTPVERALTEQLVQIAAEGRKFGLWLFLSTQRPTKIHPNVLSQCDNVGLMRINSPRDLVELAESFGFISEELLNQAQDFRQGQGLFAGGFVDGTVLAQMRTRITAEGGSDVQVPVPRSST
ncbi:ATP-binding protein [Arthrobacter psychrochitiniphilus]|uniref:ATP-binding protein n=1 Tax=Arthrobacter psychrochitiniphilus TaxID=291045 RepID=UPI003F7B3646